LFLLEWNKSPNKCLNYDLADLLTDYDFGFSIYLHTINDIVQFVHSKLGNNHNIHSIKKITVQTIKYGNEKMRGGQSSMTKSSLNQ